MRTSRAVMCVSTETGKNVTNHRSQSQNIRIIWLRTDMSHMRVCLLVTYTYSIAIAISVLTLSCTDESNKLAT